MDDDTCYEIVENTVKRTDKFITKLISTQKYFHEPVYKTHLNIYDDAQNEGSKRENAIRPIVFDILNVLTVRDQNNKNYYDCENKNLISKKLLTTFKELNVIFKDRLVNILTKLLDETLPEGKKVFSAKNTNGGGKRPDSSLADSLSEYISYSSHDFEKKKNLSNCCFFLIYCYKWYK